MKENFSIFEGGAFSDGVNNNSQSVTKRIRRFNHEQFGEVTTITDENGKVWFKANDVASALGYSIPRKAVREHCTGGSEMDLPTRGGIQPTKFIDESDVYRLVMHSKLPYAVRFQDWVCEVVLPSIRKHGAYMTDTTIEKLLTSPELVIGLATQLKEEKQKRIAAETRATYTERVLDGTLSRVAFVMLPVVDIPSNNFKLGDYDDDFKRQLAGYINNLNNYKHPTDSCGKAIPVCVPQANAIKDEVCKLYGIA